jgi:hypothetical protein
MNAIPTLSKPPVGEFVCPPGERHSPRLTHRRLTSSVVIISARGHIDASNADSLTEYSARHLRVAAD